jgi:hypothetical protein
MKLRGVERADIREAKIVKYLLSTSHRAGKSKAAFFMEFGFEPERWEELDRALRQHATDNEVAREEKTRFGTRYVIDGPLQAPDGRMLNVARLGLLTTRVTHRDSLQPTLYGGEDDSGTGRRDFDL